MTSAFAPPWSGPLSVPMAATIVEWTSVSVAAATRAANVDAFNRAKYQVPEVDKMLEEAAATNDLAKRAELYAQIQQRVLKDAVVVPLVDTVVHNAKRAEVTGDVLDSLASYVWLYDVQIKK